MATLAKPGSSSCLSFLKDALLLPSLNPKLFVPVFFLVSIPAFLVQVTNVLAIQPLTVNILELVNKLKNMDPSTAEYAKLMQEIMRDAREVIIIAIILCIAVFIISFAKQVVALFAASTTYSGDRYSLPELISKVIMKGRRIRGPLITIALVSVLELACMFLLAALLQLVIRQRGPFAMAAVLFAFLFIAFLYLNVVFMVAVAVSVADTERRGVTALGQAWRLMTQVWRKEGCVLVLVIELLSMVPSPLYMIALGYAKKSRAMGLTLLSVYALLSGVVQLFYFAAAMVYYYKATESEAAIAQDYVKIPTGEANA
ncbi:hypothetical protein PR202_gb06853 [Eleusine coracana subsp. coracana]|uniref:Uncharacterized protein n=1 Tax=Eleusine coracana subsp. coracana TaxID=191504 RepID=A0AAV5EAM8_ELECO|nr:hypothetical protein QOZ80_2BG0162770 [Eleusine coracana subsp. coracana]GJN19564.1 hypothetical protein PR202_gb06853 [Eleusine coracana subsp. coracana]